MTRKIEIDDKQIMITETLNSQMNITGNEIKSLRNSSRNYRKEILIVLVVKMPPMD